MLQKLHNLRDNPSDSEIYLKTLEQRDLFPEVAEAIVHARELGPQRSLVSFEQLQALWRPALLITVTLVLTGIVIGLWSSRLLGIDPVVALLGAAPGGISGMSLVGAEFGVGAAVAALHAVRLITVLLVLPVVVRLLTPMTLGNS